MVGSILFRSCGRPSGCLHGADGADSGEESKEIVIGCRS